MSAEDGPISLQLPVDLRTFLEERRSLVYDASKVEFGQVTLRPIEDLRMLECFVREHSEPWPDDPHRGEEGGYVVSGVDLLSEAGNHEPDGILLWLPRAEMYASWDCDHHDVVGFPGVTWADLAGDPARFLGAQWDPAHDGLYLRPWVYGYPWRAGWW